MLISALDKKRNKEFFHSLFPLKLLLILYFCQLWIDVAGVTIRSEDVLLLLFVGQFLLSILLILKLYYRPSRFNLPLLFWDGIILTSILVTTFQPFDSTTKKDAWINGVRLILGTSVFFIVYNYPATARQKLCMLFRLVIGFSFITTIVSLLQIGYWDGWLPITLPKILTERAVGANTQKGREVFGLFLGDTSAHSWATMLAIQSIVVFIYAQTKRIITYRWYWFGYAGLLILIILRMAVRNSLLGAIVAIIAISFIQAVKSRYPLNRILTPVLLSILVATGLLMFLYLAPDTYYVQQARAAIPRFKNGQLVVSGASSIYGRLEYYTLAWQLFLEKPLLGHGYYSYQALSLSYTGAYIPHAHNAYLQVLAEYGVIGFGIISWFMFQLAMFTFYLWRLKPLNHYFVLGRNLLTGLLFFSTFTGFFANPVQDPRLIGFTMFVIGSMTSYLYEARLQT